jgi:hypothetical protein
MRGRVPGHEGGCDPSKGCGGGEPELWRSEATLFGSQEMNTTEWYVLPAAILVALGIIAMIVIGAW